MKKIFDIIKELFSYGVDIFILFIFFKYLENQIILLIIILFYCLVRFYFIKHIGISIFLNSIFCLTLILSSTTQDIRNENQILSLTLFYIAILAIITSQIFVIITRSFSRNLVKPPNSTKPVTQILLKTTFVFDSFYYIVSVVLAFVYPILLTLTVVISFSGLYANINSFYNSYENESGLIYSFDNRKLDSIKIDDKLNTFEQINEIIKKDYFYFSSITYFTIGYGDITPSGYYLKILISLEMIVAHILNISFFALFGTIFYDFIKRKKVVKFDGI